MTSPGLDRSSNAVYINLLIATLLSAGLLPCFGKEVDNRTIGSAKEYPGLAFPTDLSFKMYRENS